MEELLSFYLSMITCMSTIHNIIATGLQMQNSRACYAIQKLPEQTTLTPIYK